MNATVSERTTVARMLIHQLLPVASYSKEMIGVAARVSLFPAAGMLHSAGETLHLGKHGQMPPALLVLPRLCLATLIVQGDMCDATPVVTSCLLANPGQDSQAVPYQEVTPV